MTFNYSVMATLHSLSTLTLLAPMKELRLGGRGSGLPLQQDAAVVIQDVGVRVQEDGVVAHQRCHHDQHLQLVIHPQEHRAGY